ncbi:MAG: YncE family protein [Bacteroidota bacterium]|nr:YncE family protein [Bacteroidota bacterium]
MKKLFIFIAFGVCTIYHTGCDRDDVVNPPVVVVTVNEGAYILGEGLFNNPGTAKLSYYSLISDNFFPSIFNPGILGNTPDGLILEGNNLFITEQGNTGAAGKIYKTDSNGIVMLSNNVGTNPYSLTIANGKIYISNGPAGNVSVVDKNSLATITTIPVGIYPQEILAIGNKVFVCNTSLFMGATDSTVSVIDATTDQVISTIKVRQTPSSLAKTNDGKLLVGCPGSAANAMIYKIDPGNYSKLDSFVIANGFASGFDKDIAVDATSENIYFISVVNNIVRLNMTTRVPEIFIANTNSSSFFYGYNFDSKNQKHYIADAGDFVTNGSLLVYDINGVLTNTFETGPFPRRILIKN